MSIKRGQLYKSRNGVQIIIAGKKHSKWLGKVLTDKPGVYNGSHKLAEITIKKHFELIK